MVELRKSSLDRTFHALSHPVRRKMLVMLMPGCCRVGELAAPFSISLNGASKHLKVLERAGLVRRSREGRIHRMVFEPQPLEKAARAIAFYRRFWEGQLGALARFLEPPLPEIEDDEAKY